ncbi:uncharacterized protein LOC111043559 [Nilaparvata lugens]|uniref:uncharacterized protein LOC111043559 n=1 Tax=Nilaparvata lugens TaxID=108931 RepID=UPI00193CD14F|nr:uncharacterized protein LOC111043559 [Nilaparvata lugens]XP_039295036.1 uncharacterized protein LOC111043559 [Nilaparvata lugens]
MVDTWDEKLFFTKKDKIEFVNNIKDRPGIWDHFNQTGSRQEKSDRRSQLWGEIVEIYGGKDLSPEDREDIDDLLKRRWGYYRDHYIKCYKDDTYKYKEDPFYKVFSFLNENILKKMEFRKLKKEDIVRYPKAPRRKPKSRRQMRLELTKQNYQTVGDREGESPQNGNIRVEEIPIENSQIDSVGEDELPIEIDGYQEDSMFNIVMEDSDDDTNNQSQNKDNTIVESHETNISVSNKSNKNVPVLPKTQPQSSITQSEIDECDVFGRLVAFKLRKLDLRSRTRIQYFIHQALYQAEMGGSEDQVNMS